ILKYLQFVKRDIHHLMNYLKKKWISQAIKFSQIMINYIISSKNPNSNWRSEFLTSGGGVWLDMGYHVVDIINYLLNGEKITINYAKLINSSEGEYNVDDIAFAEFECAGVTIFANISCVGMEKTEDIIAYGRNRIFHANKEGVTIKNKKQKVINFYKSEPISPFIRMYQSFSF
ncbi:Gfo/Idh/MocA family protein, partial [Shigella sp. FC1967]|uniref:Gfo/Idh/MocA family protein n=1 Tax=Shigella sp. FC1967 TaxID=1898041 RepID=UPI001C0A7098